MARYGHQFKAAVVARLLPPESTSLEAVSQKVGISVATLSADVPPPWPPTMGMAALGHGARQAWDCDGLEI